MTSSLEKEKEKGKEKEKEKAKANIPLTKEKASRVKTLYTTILVLATLEKVARARVAVKAARKAKAWHSVRAVKEKALEMIAS
jgi:hypothetical protein